MTCQHTACQSIDLTADQITLTERPDLTIRNGHPTRTFWDATGPDGRYLGSIHDRGHEIAGQWRHDWMVFAGGSGVQLPVMTFLDGVWYETSSHLAATVKSFARWCQESAGHWRDALHG